MPDARALMHIKNPELDDRVKDDSNQSLALSTRPGIVSRENVGRRRGHLYPLIHVVLGRRLMTHKLGPLC